MGYEKLDWYVNVGREEEKAKRGGGVGLAKDDDDLAAFKKKYRTKKFTPVTFQPGELVEGFVGIDGGSTSTKAVLLSKDGKRKSSPRPISFRRATRSKTRSRCCRSWTSRFATRARTLKILGVGTTGYAKDILKDVIGADAALVETVAHTEAGLHFYDDVDVICDVGGQDIKIIILKNGRVKDFKLNTQCSAGNGYFLQSTAQGFNVPVEQYADTAFGAKGFPSFGYGCAVFMQSRHRGLPAPGMEAGRDHGRPVQRAAQEYLAVRFADSQPLGHRHALPAAGRHAVQPGGGEGAGGLHRVALQGQGRAGRRDRPRALRRSRRHRRGARSGPAVGQRPQDHVHRPGCLRDHRVQDDARRSHPLLLLQEQVPAHVYRREDQLSQPDYKPPAKTKVPLEAGAQRLIIATCEKGTVENIEEMRGIKGNLDKVKKANPNFVEIAAKARFPRARCAAGGRPAAASSRSPPRRKSAPS